MSFILRTIPPSTARFATLGLVSGLLLLAACGPTAAPEPRSRAAEAVAVVAHQVDLRAETLRIDVVGTSRARASAVIYPETGGEVEQVLFGTGDYVEAGAPLVKIESTEEALAVRLAEVEVRNAEQLLARYRRIEDTGAVSDSQIDEAQTAVDAARIALDQAQVALAERTVRAPFAGYVGLTDVDPGVRITTTTQIAQLDDRQVLYVDFEAPEEVFEHLTPGKVLSVMPSASATSEFEARIVGLDSRVDPATRTLTVRAELDNASDRLRPGMSFRVLVNVHGPTHPAVPEAAILWGSDGPYIWQLHGDVVRRTDVAIVGREAGYVLVRGDVGEGASIVLEGIQKVRDGTLVTVVDGADEGAPTEVAAAGAAAEAAP